MLLCIRSPERSMSWNTQARFWQWAFVDKFVATSLQDGPLQREPALKRRQIAAGLLKRVGSRMPNRASRHKHPPGLGTHETTTAISDMPSEILWKDENRSDATNPAMCRATIHTTASI